MDWDLLSTRLEPATGDVALTAPAVTVAFVAALLVVAVPAIWQVMRLAVTLVHELGHALVGLAVGRRFTGFVLRGDMSGHAVTVGPPRGPGRVLTTWAGYPAPAVVGAALVWAAGRGWGAPVLSVVIVILLVALVRVRSLLTAVVMLVALGATGALWWWRDDAVQAQVLVGAGIVLLVGAWRHLGAVLRTRDRSSDPGVLAALTHVPRLVWNASFVLVCAAATVLAASAVARAWQ
ncbi:M50 family metallopeptidase [Pedococcus bigeumensis]|uniref:M50 family peptidase n=1 Tax=Pedococcus bigeumensis TaxID=433644 RepID=A0A502D2V7_9MICO|nr:M50 family metallopeptidase [Pedococcus bigeumensis]TPG19172.1 M50 family peptidase [Pedococcus bigeumensis]